MRCRISPSRHACQCQQRHVVGLRHARPRPGMPRRVSPRTVPRRMPRRSCAAPPRRRARPCRAAAPVRAGEEVTRRRRGSETGEPAGTGIPAGSVSGPEANPEGTVTSICHLSTQHIPLRVASVAKERSRGSAVSGLPQRKGLRRGARHPRLHLRALRACRWGHHRPAREGQAQKPRGKALPKGGRLRWWARIGTGLRPGGRQRERARGEAAVAISALFGRRTSPAALASGAP